VLGGRRRVARAVEEHDPLDDREPHGPQAEAGAVEVLELVGERRVAQASVEAVGPRVVAALQAREAALGVVLAPSMCG
jgi:hypothetical protein